MKKILLIVVFLAMLLSGCSQSDVASQNLSTAADNFQINRRIHFYNGITGEDFLVIEGLCVLGNYDTAGSSIKKRMASRMYGRDTCRWWGKRILEFQIQSFY